MANVTATLTKAFHKSVNVIKENSPKILVVSGLVLGVAASISACVATTKAEEIIDRHNEELGKIEEAKKIAEASNSEEYTEKDIIADKVKIFANTIWMFIRLYWLALALGIASGTAILLGFNILNKRFGYVTAALTTQMCLFNDYRGRVIEDQGEEKDRQYLLGSHIETETIEEETTDPETGKTKKTKKKQEVEVFDIKADAATGAIRVFAEFNPSGKRNKEWSKYIDVVISTLKAKEVWWNEVFRYYGTECKPMSLNEVAIDCGLDWTDDGQVLGWEWEEGKVISFGIPDWKDPQMQRLLDGTSDCLVLHFNVDPKPIIGKRPSKEKKLKG